MLNHRSVSTYMDNPPEPTPIHGQDPQPPSPPATKADLAETTLAIVTKIDGVEKRLDAKIDAVERQIDAVATKILNAIDRRNGNR